MCSRTDTLEKAPLALLAFEVMENLRDSFFWKLGEWLRNLETTGYESAIIFGYTQGTTETLERLWSRMVTNNADFDL